MNSKKLGAISFGLATVLVLTVVGTNGFALQNQSKLGYIPAPPDYPLLSAIPKTPVSNEQEASEKTGHKVVFPAYLPAGYKIQLSNIDEGIHATIVLASPTPFTSTTTRDQFLYQQKGIDIYMEPLGPNFNPSVWIKGYTAQQSGRVISINGYDGVIVDTKQVSQDDGVTSVAPGTLVLLKDGMMITITSTLPSDELIRVANSL